MIDDTIHVGELTIKPNLDKEIKWIHPAIGVIDDVAYVGVWIPCEVEDMNGNIAYKNLLFIICSNRDAILADDETLRPKGWSLGHKPIEFDNRWTLKDVNKFLADDSVIDPNIVFNHVVKTWKRYMEFRGIKEYNYHALWDIGTYFHFLYNAFPYLYIGGVKRSGKSKDLTIHSCLAFNAFFSNNMSTSSIYRLIQNARGTLLIDETEKLGYKSANDRTLEFRSILLSGYKRGTKVYRIEKTKRDRLEPRGFEVYAPKALANIRGLEDVLEDRANKTVLRKTLNKKVANLEVDINSNEFSELRGELYRLFLGHWKEIKHIYDKVRECSELNELVNIFNITIPEHEGIEYLLGRELELWTGIFSLAIFFDKHMAKIKNEDNNMFTSSLGSLCTQMLMLAAEQAVIRHVENMTETGEVILIQVLLNMVTEDNYYSVKKIKDGMLSTFDEEQKWLHSRWIGSALRRLDFKEKRRVGTGYQYMLRVADVQDLAERMQIPIPPPSKTFGEKLTELKKWIIANKDADSQISLEHLTKECKKLGLQVAFQQVLKELLADNFLMESTAVGHFMVVK